MEPLDPQAAIETTRRWIAGVVIDLNLCPFARKVFDADRIRYVVSEATEEKSLLEELRTELETLATADRNAVETTVLIHPQVLTNFMDYNDFLARADRLLKTLKLEGVIQIASFHPDYQFEGTTVDSVENFTNRSPYPMLHLLREASISELAMSEVSLQEIPERNIRTLRTLGRDEMVRRLKALDTSPPRKQGMPP